MSIVDSVGMQGMHSAIQQVPARNTPEQAAAGAQKPAENTQADVAEDARAQAASSQGIGQNLDQVV